MSRLARTLLLTAVAFCLVAPSASAAPTSQLGDTLGDLWTTVLQTPTPQNPFAGGDTCVMLAGNIVAPFGPSGAEKCTVMSGTKIFVAAWTTECSTFKGDTCGGANEAELRANARAADAGIMIHTVNVDGPPVPVTEVETGLLSIHLPQDNIFGLNGADRNGLSVAHGWVVLLDPLAPGMHEIKIHIEGTYFGQHVNSTITTKIIVQ